MSAPRLFVDVKCEPGSQVDLERGDARHLATVLRMKPGDEVTVVAERAVWKAVLADVRGDRAIATILALDVHPSPELPVAVAVLQAIPKGTKMDDVVEKVVELGAAAVVPVRCARSYGGDSPSKVERWRRIARAAAQQSQRLFVPAVEEPVAFGHALARYAPTMQLIVAHERAQRGSLAAALQQREQPLAIVIGPEGSFTDEELREARDAGSSLASIGPAVLRTETAAAAMLAAIAALRGWW